MPQQPNRRFSRGWTIPRKQPARRRLTQPLASYLVYPGMMIQFVTFGMFIIDEFDFADEQGKPTGQTVPPQIGGGGTYATIGARIWLPPDTLGMIIDRGNDFPQEIEKKLLTYGPDVWHFRDQSDRCTTRGMNSYRGEYRGSLYFLVNILSFP